MDNNECGSFSQRLSFEGTTCPFMQVSKAFHSLNSPCHAWYDRENPQTLVVNRVDRVH